MSLCAQRLVGCWPKGMIWPWNRSHLHLPRILPTVEHVNDAHLPFKDAVHQAQEEFRAEVGAEVATVVMIGLEAYASDALPAAVRLT